MRLYHNRRLSITYCCLLSFLILSCSPEEQLIDTSSARWKIIAATAEDPTSIALISQPSNTILSADAYNDANGKKLAGKVLSINEYLESLYLIMPDSRTIEVVDAATLKSLHTINTTRTPVAICFANSTTAFIANDDSTVSVLDMTVARITQDIIVGKKPKAIAAMGYYVGVCNQESNTLSIIDTRNRAVARTISLPPAPTFIAAEAEGTGEFIVVCLGDGKTGVEVPATSAYLVGYNPFKDSRAPDVELLESGVDAVNVIPRALAVSPAEIACIALGSEVISIDTRDHVAYSFRQAGTFDFCTYNFRRREILLANTSSATSEVMTVDATASQVISRFSLPMTARAVFPYYIP